MTRIAIIENFKEQIANAKQQKLINKNLNKKFKAFYTECELFLQDIANHSDREISRTLLFLTEMNIMAEKFNQYTCDEFYKQYDKIHSLKAGIPERICNYGLKFLITATMTISTALVMGMILFTFAPASLPLILSGVLGGAIIGAATGAAAANDNVDRRCNRFFRPSDSQIIKTGEDFLFNASSSFHEKDSDNYENYTPQKRTRIYNPNGNDSPGCGVFGF